MFIINLIFSIPTWLRVLLSICYLGLIISLSLLPSYDLPDIPLFRGADKIINTCMYLGLTTLACWSLHAEIKHKRYFFIAIMSISWGAIMEVFQYLMHMGRSFDYLDMVGNSVGTIIGIFIYMLMAHVKKSHDTIEE